MINILDVARFLLNFDNIFKANLKLNVTSLISILLQSLKIVETSSR